MRRRRLQTQIVEPAQLLVSSLRNEPGRKHLAKDRIVAAPQRRKADDGFVHLGRLFVAASQRTARKTAAQDHSRDTFGVACRVRNADGRAMRHAEQRERFLHAGGVDDLLEIPDAAIHRQIADVPVGHAAATLVVADVAVVIAQKAGPVVPYRTLEVMLEVGQPGGRLHQRRPRARLRPREPSAVRSTVVANCLTTLQAHHCKSQPGIRVVVGTFVPLGAGGFYRHRDVLRMARAGEAAHSL